MRSMDKSMNQRADVTAALKQKSGSPLAWGDAIFWEIVPQVNVSQVCFAHKSRWICKQILKAIAMCKKSKVGNK